MHLSYDYIIIATIKNNLESTIFPCPKCNPTIFSTRASKIRNILMQHQTHTYSQRGLVVRAIVSEADVPGSNLDGGMNGYCQIVIGTAVNSCDIIANRNSRFPNGYMYS